MKPTISSQAFKEDEPSKPVLLEARLPSSFSYVSSKHETVLVGNRFLSRGDGGILVSTSGMGKSSLAFELGANWALGKDFHGGLKPRIPLKTLIVQSEDGDGDVAEVYHSFCHGKQLSAEQRTMLDQNMRILTDRIHRGLALVKELKRQIELFKPDIIIINPLLAFIDGDLNSAEDAGRFLREQLNSLNEPAQFAYLIIHHTSKPPKEKTERRWNEVMYDMAGSGDLTNWARAIISLRPCDEEGHFELSLVKRGRRAGFTKQVAQGVGWREEPITRIGLKHSSEFFRPPGAEEDIPLIMWETWDLPEASSTGKKGGRPEKYVYRDYQNLMPAKETEGLDVEGLWRALRKNGEIPKKSIHQTMEKWRDQGHVEIIDGKKGVARKYRALI
jgi:hypothetical protein